LRFLLLGWNSLLSEDQTEEIEEAKELEEEEEE